MLLLYPLHMSLRFLVFSPNSKSFITKTINGYNYYSISIVASSTTLWMAARHTGNNGMTAPY